MAGRVRSHVPQASVIGMLLGYHPDYTVVRSTGSGFAQHDAFTWQVLGARFETVDNLSLSSQMVDETLHTWLKNCTPDQRRVFVDTLFDILDSTNAQTFAEMKKGGATALALIMNATAKVDAETGRMIMQLFGKLVLAGVDSVTSQITRRIGDWPAWLLSNNDVKKPEQNNTDPQ